MTKSNNVFEVLFTPEFAKKYQDLSPKDQEKVEEAIEQIQNLPSIGKKLKGMKRHLMSYRLGVYRIIYEIIKVKNRIIFITVDLRRDVYKKL
ncbi:MAG: type II toxin-antitoxin system RelE family toxin [Promethearchaeota archaeon]